MPYPGTTLSVPQRHICTHMLPGMRSRPFLRKQVTINEKAEKPAGVNMAHKKWVRQVESELAAQKLGSHIVAEQEAAKSKAVGDFSAKLRAAILAHEDMSFWKAARRPGGMTWVSVRPHTAM